MAELELREALAQIDWRRPWLAPFAAVGAALTAELLGCIDDAAAYARMLSLLSEAAAARGLRNALGLPIVFIAQAELPDGVAYEAHIYATGDVPTRPNLHDFFNALIWLHLPAIKIMLNRIQARAIAQSGVLPSRGGIRDAATLFDENAVLFVCDTPKLATALAGFDWTTLFATRRADWGPHCTVIPFGHALLEKLVLPYKSITAHAWRVAAMTTDTLAAIDAQVAGQLDGITLASRDFCPLPVLGIPGWWAPNEDPGFYRDPAVFRAGRMRDQRTPPAQTPAG